MAFVSKKDKRINETRELAEKQRNASEKFKQANSIMQREVKTTHDYEKAIQLYTEAITLLYIFFYHFIKINKTGKTPLPKMKKCLRNSMPQEEQFSCKLGSFNGLFMIIPLLRGWMIKILDISVISNFLLLLTP